MISELKKDSALAEFDWESPEFRQALSVRVRECAKKVGSADQLSAKSGIPRRSLGDYLKGDAEPKVSRLIRIAKAADVSVEWLATGLDIGDRNKEVAIFNEPLLRNVVEAVENLLSKENSNIGPSKKANLICLLYEWYMSNDESEVDMTNVVKFVNLANEKG